jgi:peptidoglycan/xylan/chitin deacetylase (PgdA/CDA1 family)
MVNERLKGTLATTVTVSLGDLFAVMAKVLRQAVVLLAVTVAVALKGLPVSAAECSNKTALGTFRTMPVGAAKTPRVGLKSFPTTLPLADKEVVLTFDDGPFPPTTRRVLSALADECVHATFFLIGQNAARSPDLVRKIAADGHGIGYHTWSHRILGRVGQNVAEDEINRGIAAVENIIGKPTAPRTVAQTSAPGEPTRFFRFPGFVSTPKLLDELNSRNMVIFGADLWASDWNKMTPDQELSQVVGRLKAARKGIILFHDIKAQTAAMLPGFLRFLKDNGYHVVQVVPSGSAEPDSGK